MEIVEQPLAFLGLLTIGSLFSFLRIAILGNNSSGLE